MDFDGIFLIEGLCGLTAPSVMPRRLKRHYSCALLNMCDLLLFMHEQRKGQGVASESY